MEFAYLAEGGAVRPLPVEEAAAWQGGGFVWIHVEGADERELALIRRKGGIPDIAASALIATETRPRCDRIDSGAIVNLRGLGAVDPTDSDPLVSIRMWVREGKIHSVSRRPLRATKAAREGMEAGTISDPGDLVAIFARAISTELDPEVADLGDRLDEAETRLEPKHLPELRRTITSIRSHAIGYRRFVAPDRDALLTLAAQDFRWLSDEDRLHIREAADRFARMAEELEAVRERAALLHEQITDLRTEQVDQRALWIAIVAFIFLPLTFITGLLGMNVEGIPFATRPWAFWGVVGFCVAVGAFVLGWFIRRHWLKR